MQMFVVTGADHRGAQEQITEERFRFVTEWNVDPRTLPGLSKACASPSETEPALYSAFSNMGLTVSALVFLERALTDEV